MRSDMINDSRPEAGFTARVVSPGPLAAIPHSQRVEGYPGRMSEDEHHRRER